MNALYCIVNCILLFMAYHIAVILFTKDHVVMNNDID